MVIIKDIALPEFSKSIKINEIEAYIFNNPSSIYDIILGWDLLKKSGIDLSFSTKMMKWFDMSISMKPQDYWLKQNDLHYMMLEDTDDILYFTEIKPSKYESVNPNDIIKNNIIWWEQKKRYFNDTMSIF